MAKLIIKSQTLAPQEIELKAGINRFGRSEGNDHLLNHPEVSERHCEILVENSFVMVRDLGSTNGTFIDQQQIKEAALYSGQTLQIGPVEMVLDAPPVVVAIPELPALSRPVAPTPGMLSDGYASCLNHAMRHAVWECNSCGRFYCDQCVRKLRRVGGAFLKFCPACSNMCKFSPWSLMVKARKKSLIAKLADKVKSSFKRTKQLLADTVKLPRSRKNKSPRNE